MTPSGSLKPERQKNLAKFAKIRQLEAKSGKKLAFTDIYKLSVVMAAECVQLSR